MPKLGEPIALGRTSELYAWGDGRVLKLFLATYPRWWAEDEIRYQQAVAGLGLPTPVFYQALDVDGRAGMVLERLTGRTLLELGGRQPWRLGYVGRVLADLQSQLHTRQAPQELKTQRDWITPGIVERDLSPAGLKQRVITTLLALSDGPWLCHGDMHPGNVVMTPRGPMILDWMMAKRGLPVSDLARSSALLTAGQVPPGTPLPGLVDRLRRWMHRAYLTRYQQLNPIALAHWHGWRAVMAANYLDVSVESERPALLALVSQELDAAASEGLGQPGQASQPGQTTSGGALYASRLGRRNGLASQHQPRAPRFRRGLGQSSVAFGFEYSVSTHYHRFVIAPLDNDLEPSLWRALPGIHPGALYLLLCRMETSGLFVHHVHVVAAIRRYYTITPDGRDALAVAQRQALQLMAEVSTPSTLAEDRQETL